MKFKIASVLVVISMISWCLIFFTGIAIMMGFGGFKEGWLEYVTQQAPRTGIIVVALCDTGLVLFFSVYAMFSGLDYLRELGYIDRVGQR